MTHVNIHISPGGISAYDSVISLDEKFKVTALESGDGIFVDGLSVHIDIPGGRSRGAVRTASVQREKRHSIILQRPVFVHFNP